MGIANELKNARSVKEQRSSLLRREAAPEPPPLRLKRVDLNEVCRDFGVRFAPYAKCWEEPPAFTEQTPGVCFMSEEGRPTVLYDGRRPPQALRFVVAHELGHLFLGHVKGELAEELRSAWARFRLPSSSTAVMEREADLFAAVLLAFDLLCQYGVEERGGPEG